MEWCGISVLNKRLNSQKKLNTKTSNAKYVSGAEIMVDTDRWTGVLQLGREKAQ